MGGRLGAAYSGGGGRREEGWELAGGVGVEDKPSAENLDFQIVPGMAAAGVGWVATIS